MVKDSPNKNPGPLKRVLPESKRRERTIVNSKPRVYSNSEQESKSEKAPKSKFKIALNILAGIIFFIIFLYLTGFLKIEVDTNENNPEVNTKTEGSYPDSSTENNENYPDSTDSVDSTEPQVAEIVSEITSASCKTRVPSDSVMMELGDRLATLEVSGTATSVFQTYPDEYGLFHNAVGDDDDYYSSYIPLTISYSEIGVGGIYEYHSYADCGSWTEYKTSDVTEYIQCFRAKGQPETTSWTMKWDNRVVDKEDEYALVYFPNGEDFSGELKVPCN